MVKRIKAMVVSLGGTPAPVILSLNKSRPEYICFFISRETKRMLEEEILPRLDFKPRHYDWIVTPNAELLSECYSELTKKLPEIIDKWEVTPTDVCVDYTGGTKTMSVALVLATINNSCCYSYVGGDERSKGGVGVVIDGKERMRFLDNPWDEIALSERREVSVLFNKARYSSAADLLGKCIERVNREQKPYFKALQEMVKGYDLWDRFQHREAKEKLYKCRDILMTFSYASLRKESNVLSGQLQTNIQFLENFVSDKGPSVLYFYDLLANARRRADLERKFDDAVARLYRAMEVLAQMELRSTYGIDTSDVKEKDIPDVIREEYSNKYQDEKGSKIKIPFLAAFRLLKELGNELSESFFKVYDKEIKYLLSTRNNSILAHGFIAVDEKIFQKLFESVMKFSGTKDEDLPKFPFLQI
jgi:CRISPR-associated protein (TIGR02710 family)